MAAPPPPPAPRTTPTARRIALLKGHTEGVACLAVAPERAGSEAAACLLASGAEDGGVCIHSLASQQLLCKAQLSTGSDSEQAGVGALAFAAAAPPSSGSNGDAGLQQHRVLFAGVGAELAVLLLTQAAGAGAAEVAGGVEAPTTTNTTTTAVDEAPPSWRLQVLQRQGVSSDDISSLAVNSQGTFLAAADDTGDVCLFDISALQQQLVQGQPWRQQQQQQPLQPLRTIVGAHDPMACAVAFRGPSKPWQLLSGGVDNRVALWDFSRPKKCCGSWNMAHMAGQHPQLQVQGSAAAGADEQQQHQQQQGQQQQGQLWNPPFVHALALPATAATAEGRGEPATSVLPVPPAVVKRLVAAARGDGVVSVFDADPDAKPVKASSSGGKQAGAAAPPLSHQQAASKGKKAASKSKVAASTPPPAAAQATQGPEQQQQQQQPLALAQVPPGFHVCLDGRFGGHTLAAASVAFMPCGGGHRLLWSGGQDGRLLLWDWAAALSAGGSASGGAAGPLVLDVAHKRKVNALACCWELGASSTGGEQRPVWLLVAGTSRNVNVYRVTGCRA